MTELKFWNTLTRAKEEFTPIDPGNVRMYVCGPTVYDFAHIGNARPAIVFDVLFRLLRHVYGEDHVTYVRNLTDVDDKINARALRDYPELPLNEAIARVTEKTADRYHKDVAALGCLPPTHEPRATAHIDGMVRMIQTLIDKGNAYVASGREGREVLFAVSSMPDYGKLSNRRLEEQQAGARIAVEDHKRNPADFVLWKESAADEPGWDGTFSEGGQTLTIHGRPGWHIECSVMSEHHLGQTFDIHGGGLDLIFPHHENEIAQSCCAHGNDRMANLWMHNGFLQVEGKKMSKSEGNFVTIAELLRGQFPGWEGGPWHGLVLRLAMLKTHYRQPIDWTLKKLLEARSTMQTWSIILSNWSDENWPEYQRSGFNSLRSQPFEEVVEALSDDLNTSDAISFLARFIDRQDYKNEIDRLYSSLELLGLVNEKMLSANPVVTSISIGGSESMKMFSLATDYGVAYANNDVQTCDSISTALASNGWRISKIFDHHIDLGVDNPTVDVQVLVNQRLALIADKNWAEADRIRDELLAKGIQLKDGKDPQTGERVTTWEVRR